MQVLAAAAASEPPGSEPAVWRTVSPGGRYLLERDEHRGRLELSAADGEVLLRLAEPAEPGAASAWSFLDDEVLLVTRRILGADSVSWRLELRHRVFTSSVDPRAQPLSALASAMRAAAEGHSFASGSAQYILSAAGPVVLSLLHLTFHPSRFAAHFLSAALLLLALALLWCARNGRRRRLVVTDARRAGHLVSAA